VYFLDAKWWLEHARETFVLRWMTAQMTLLVYVCMFPHSQQQLQLMVYGTVFTVALQIKKKILWASHVREGLCVLSFCQKFV
jgi:hypothetical protein